MDKAFATHNDHNAWGDDYMDGLEDLEHWSGCYALQGFYFAHCDGCGSVLDPWDLIVGDFGDLHCAYCSEVIERFD